MRKLSTLLVLAVVTTLVLPPAAGAAGSPPAMAPPALDLGEAFAATAPEAATPEALLAALFGERPAPASHPVCEEMGGIQYDSRAQCLSECFCGGCNRFCTFDGCCICCP